MKINRIKKKIKKRAWDPIKGNKLCIIKYNKVSFKMFLQYYLDDY